MTTHTTICKFQYSDVPSHKPLPSSFGKRTMTNFDFFDYCSNSWFFYARRRQHSQRKPTKTGVADCSQSRCCFWANDLVSRLQAKSGGNELSSFLQYLWFAQLLLGVPASSMASQRAFSLDFLPSVLEWGQGQNSQGWGRDGDDNDGDRVGIVKVTVTGRRWGEKVVPMQLSVLC